ncbi:MAG: SPOR domain-containing protein, partial [Candidatus Binatus sp.]
PPPALPPGTRPYNIQIEAVMDKSGADEMVARLKALGYNAQEAKVALNGQTWYRVRVGPYASADEATAAQNRLRDQYRQAYTTSH